MKIILIDTGLGEQGFDSFGKDLGNSAVSHGLCSLSAYAKSHGFKEIELIDLRSLKGWEEFRKIWPKPSPKVAGITAVSGDFGYALTVAKIIKEISPETRVVVGGVHATVATEDALSCEQMDHVITGEGEISFLELLRAVENQEPFPKLTKGVCPDLSLLPWEDRELYNYKRSMQFVNFPGIFKAPHVGIIASRGCPFNCTFCAPHAKTMFGAKVRYRPAEQVAEEIAYLKKRYQFRSLSFYDYSITLNSEWCFDFCDRIDRMGIKMLIWANSRADIICKNEKAIKRLKDIGLQMMSVGFESGSQRMLDFLKKGVTVEQNLKAAEILKRNGIIVRGLFMLGAPTETKEDVNATMDLISKMKPHVYSFSYFTPIPGTHLFNYCKERNISLIKDYTDYAHMGPEIPKIKGIDYEYLKKEVEKSMGSRFGGSFAGKIIRMILVRTKASKWLKLRYFLKYLYVKWVIAFDRISYLKSRL